MTTTLTHKQKVQELRSLIKSEVCKTLRVVMSKGSAWGNVKIKGSGEFGYFSDAEKAALTAYNFNFGANCGIIMYEDLDACIARLNKRIEADNAALREEIRARVNPLGFTHRYVNLAAITDDARTISQQFWCTSPADIYDAETKLIKMTTPEEQRWNGKIVLATIFDMFTKQTRCFKVRSEKIYEITDEVMTS